MRMHENSCTSTRVSGEASYGCQYLTVLSTIDNASYRLREAGGDFPLHTTRQATEGDIVEMLSNEGKATVLLGRYDNTHTHIHTHTQIYYMPPLLGV